MTTDIIEGTAITLDHEALPSAVVVAQPGQALVAEAGDPSAMVAVAARLASVLKDIVDTRQLYAMIQGKKYPTVEAWMTIARLDNVVAREARPPVRHEDGSYEAFAELVRLSDGMVIGAASALCGSPDDEPWGGTPAKYGKPAKGPRPEHARRSMASTRSISRAFRAHYSWIMALAGYEPTPADEMPHEMRDVTPHRDEQRPPGAYDGPPDRDELVRFADGLIGEVAQGKPPVDLQMRQTPDGPAWGFKLMQGRKGFQALAIGPLADALSLAGIEVGTRVTVWGRIDSIPWAKDGKDMPPYSRIAIERVQTPDWTLPAQTSATETPEPVEAESVPLFELTDEEKAAIRVSWDWKGRP